MQYNLIYNVNIELIKKEKKKVIISDFSHSEI